MEAWNHVPTAGEDTLMSVKVHVEQGMPVQVIHCLVGGGGPLPGPHAVPQMRIFNNTQEQCCSLKECCSNGVLIIVFK